MESQNLELIKIVLGSTGLLGIGAGMLAVVFRTGKIVQKIDDMDKRIDDGFKEVDNHFKEIDNRFKEVDARFRKLEESSLATINIAIARLEVRLEERTLKTVDISQNRPHPENYSIK